MRGSLFVRGKHLSNSLNKLISGLIELGRSAVTPPIRVISDYVPTVGDRLCPASHHIVWQGQGLVLELDRTNFLLRQEHAGQFPWGGWVKARVNSGMVYNSLC